MQQLLASILPDQASAGAPSTVAAAIAGTQQAAEKNGNIPVDSFSSILEQLSITSQASSPSLQEQIPSIDDLVLQEFPLNGKYFPQELASDTGKSVSVTELTEKLNILAADLKLGSKDQILVEQILQSLPEQSLEQQGTETNIVIPSWLFRLVNSFQAQLDGNANTTHQQASIARSAPFGSASAEQIQSLNQNTSILQSNVIQSNVVSIDQTQNTNGPREFILPDLNKLTANTVEARPIEATTNTINPSLFSQPLGGQETVKSTTPTLQLQAPFNQAEWKHEIGDRVRWMVNQNIQTAELRLNPPQLGPIEVKISFNNEQMNVMFTAQNSVVREALESAIPRLREMMGESGLNLVDVDVSEQSHSEKHPQTDQDDNRYVSDETAHGQDDELVEELVMMGDHSRMGLGLIDTYA